MSAPVEFYPCLIRNRFWSSAWFPHRSLSREKGEGVGGWRMSFLPPSFLPKAREAVGVVY